MARDINIASRPLRNSCRRWRAGSMAASLPPCRLPTPRTWCRPRGITAAQFANAGSKVPSRGDAVASGHWGDLATEEAPPRRASHRSWQRSCRRFVRAGRRGTLAWCAAQRNGEPAVASAARVESPFDPSSPPALAAPTESVEKVPSVAPPPSAARGRGAACRYEKAAPAFKERPDFGRRCRSRFPKSLPKTSRARGDQAENPAGTRISALRVDRGRGLPMTLRATKVAVCGWMVPDVTTGLFACGRTKADTRRNPTCPRREWREPAVGAPFYPAQATSSEPRWIGYWPKRLQRI